MAEDLGEKTEPATPKRRMEARKRGQIAKSQDLSATVVMLGGLLLLSVLAPDLLARLVSATRLLLGERSPAVRAEELFSAAGLATQVAWNVCWPIFLCSFLLAAVVMYVQVGRLVTLETIRPKLNKLNPVNGLKRLFSPRTFVALVINTLKMAAVVVVTYLTVRQRFGDIVFSLKLSHLALLAAAGSLIYTLALRLGLLLLVLALMDYAYQRYRTERDLRMTKQEVKEELKRMEGDPLVKRRQRQVAMSITLQRIRKSVPQADVVVTNPTELAVALKYEAKVMSAPKVVAKGSGYLARRIRQMAIEHGVPLVERPPLAQALFRAVEVGQEIPVSFYQAVAEILAYVYRLPGRPGPRAEAMAT